MIVLPFFSRISSFFGRRHAPTKGASSFHKGIDIAAPAGTPVYAAADGVITVRESQRGYGNVVYIKHPDGTETRYGHLSGFSDLPAGAQVRAGSLIGYVGSTGVSTGNHLHFEVRNALGQAVDPQAVFGAGLDNYRAMPAVDGFNPALYTGATTGLAQNNVHLRHPLASTQQESDDIIAFEYKKRILPQEEALAQNKNRPTQTSIFSLFNLGKEGLLGFLLGNRSENADNTNQNEETAEEFFNRPEVQFRLSKTDMKNNGFTDNEISLIERFAAFKKQEGLNGTLSEAGQAITPEELAQIGLQPDKIDLFNRLADMKLQAQSNQHQV